MKNIFRRQWLFSLFLVLANPVQGQDYIAYQAMLNRVEHKVQTADMPAALLLMDTLGRDYTFIYARHCLKGLQLAAAADDPVRAAYWLRRSFLQGVPLWLLRINTLTASALHYSTAEPVLNAYDSLRAVYRSGINTEVAARIRNMIAVDARYTNRLNNSTFLSGRGIHFLQWRRNNTREVKELFRIIKQHGFPGERMIGLEVAPEDSVAMAALARSNGIDWAADQSRALFMLLHYCSTRRSDISTILYPCIKDGYLPVAHYARICDYLVINSPHTKAQAYAVFASCKEAKETVDQRRAAIGLCSLEEQALHDQLRLQRRQKPGSGREIIIEYP